MKKTLVLGATTNPQRMAYQAVHRLKNNGHSVVLLGIRQGEVANEPIITDKNRFWDDIHTVTLYVSPQNQEEWYDYILKTNPKRIIFNPGTENLALVKLAQEKGIQTEFACTLVLLGNGLY